MRPKEYAAETRYVGQRLRQRRRELGMTQRAVAGDRYTPAYISALENGLVHPSFASLMHLGRALRVYPSYFLEGIGGSYSD
jgi:transcriptional regulator with XRE-family HTH domain